MPPEDYARLFGPASLRQGPLSPAHGARLVPLALELPSDVPVGAVAHEATTACASQYPIALNCSTVYGPILPPG